MGRAARMPCAGRVGAEGEGREQVHQHEGAEHDEGGEVDPVPSRDGEHLGRERIEIVRGREQHLHVQLYRMQMAHPQRTTTALHTHSPARGPRGCRVPPCRGRGAWRARQRGGAAGRRAWRCPRSWAGTPTRRASAGAPAACALGRLQAGAAAQPPRGSHCWQYQARAVRRARTRRRRRARPLAGMHCATACPGSRGPCSQPSG
eukprot:scaffold7695_cov64-Phaeocystis_antarctica.AAC.9